MDGVALAPHRQVDVKALDVDFYVSDPIRNCSFSKKKEALLKSDSTE